MAKENNKVLDTIKCIISILVEKSRSPLFSAWDCNDKERECILQYQVKYIATITNSQKKNEGQTDIQIVKLTRLAHQLEAMK